MDVHIMRDISSHTPLPRDVVVDGYVSRLRNEGLHLSIYLLFRVTEQPHCRPDRRVSRERELRSGSEDVDFPVFVSVSRWGVQEDCLRVVEFLGYALFLRLGGCWARGVEEDDGEGVALVWGRREDVEGDVVEWHGGFDLVDSERIRVDGGREDLYIDGC